MSQLATCKNRTAGPDRLEYVVPAVNLHHDTDGFILEVEMPGVKKDGVEITFDDGKLTLVGHRASPTPEGSAVYKESSGLAYRRVFDLDPSIDEGKIGAKMDQGLLTIRLPKAETSKPRKIAVA